VISVSSRRPRDSITRVSFGRAAHELRDLLNTSLLAFQALKRGDVAINGSTGAVLGRSLMGLRDTINGALTDVRLSSGKQQRQRLSVVQCVQVHSGRGPRVAASARRDRPAVSHTSRRDPIPAAIDDRVRGYTVRSTGPSMKAGAACRSAVRDPESNGARSSSNPITAATAAINA
jgi:hypothetical protein